MGLMQDCSNSIAFAMELLQSCAKPLLSLKDYVHQCDGCKILSWPDDEKYICCKA